MTFADIAIKEGDKYRKTLEKTTGDILEEFGFTRDGKWPEGMELPPELRNQDMEYILIDPVTIMEEAGLASPENITFAEGEYSQPETGCHPVKHKRRGERLLVPDEERKKYLESYVRYINVIPDRDKYGIIRHPFKIEKNVNAIVNIFIDGVLVPEQSEHRIKGGKPQGRTEKTNIKHIDIRLETDDGFRYNISNVDIDIAYQMLLALLLKTGMINRYLHFFVDGEKKLKEKIEEYFKHWAHTTFLDNYHADEKIDTLMSLGIKSIRVPNPWEEPVLYKNNTRNHKKGDIKDQPMTSISRTYGAVVKRAIFYGNIDEAIEFITHIPSEHIDDQDSLDELVEYFKFRKDMLTCYALRKHAGLKNSSNSSELCNEEVICARQKVDDRMHWREKGSAAIAALTLMFLNQENEHWFKSSKVSFRLYQVEPTKIRQRLDQKNEKNQAA